MSDGHAEAIAKATAEIAELYDDEIAELYDDEITAAVELWPPLTDSQRADLLVILAGAGHET